MGTHPIFESDFDCLTEMRFSRVLRGGGNWDLIPPEKIPSPTFWNKVIKGTPYEFTQVQLNRKGLHDPWLRHNIVKYDNVQRKPHLMVTWCNDDVIKMALVITFLIVFIEEGLGYYPFGRDPRVVKNVAWDENATVNAVPPIEGDEHIRNFRGRNIIDMEHFGQPSSKTPNLK